MSEHEHEWRPIAGWVGRYRCIEPTCDVVGHRPTYVDITLGRGHREQIIPYLCAKRVRGVKCEKPATHTSTDRSKNRCREHRK